MRPITARVTVANPIAYVRLDPYHGAALAVQAVIETGGGGPIPGPEATAYLARTVGGNEGGNAANITTLINGLVADGVWVKLDGLYILAQQNATDALLNLCGTSYPLVNSGSTFAAYQGFHGFGTAGLSSGFNPSIAPSPKYTITSASIGGWAYNEIIGNNGYLIGMAINQTGIFDNFSGNTYLYINVVSPVSVTGGEANGLYAGDLSPTAVSLYYNGVSVSAAGGGSPVLANANFTVGNESGAAYPTAETVSAAYIGGYLGATLQTAIYNRLRTYMTAVGVP